MKITSKYRKPISHLQNFFYFFFYLMVNISLITLRIHSKSIKTSFIVTDSVTIPNMEGRENAIY